MIKFLSLCIFYILIAGCSSIGELAANTIAGALGNMLDRRAEGKLGNNAQIIDEELENKYACQNTEYFKAHRINEENRKEIILSSQLCTIPYEKKEIVILPNNI